MSSSFTDAFSDLPSLTFRAWSHDPLLGKTKPKQLAVFSPTFLKDEIKRSILTSMSCFSFQSFWQKYTLRIINNLQALGSRKPFYVIRCTQFTLGEWSLTSHHLHLGTPSGQISRSVLSSSMNKTSCLVSEKEPCPEINPCLHSQGQEIAEAFKWQWQHHFPLNTTF